MQGLLGVGFQLVTLKEIGCEEELPEERGTFEGNSFQKAKYVYGKYDCPCFADDSGLEVEALNGSPGIYSARYAGPQRSPEDNMNLLLKNMEGVTQRRAHFKAVITFVARDHIHQFEGISRGLICREKKGMGGFGYDPVFLPDGYSETFAEMSTQEKNKISHRAIAIKKFVEFLKTIGLGESLGE